MAPVVVDAAEAYGTVLVVVVAVVGAIVLETYGGGFVVVAVDTPVVVPAVPVAVVLLVGTKDIGRVRLHFAKIQQLNTHRMTNPRHMPKTMPT